MSVACPSCKSHSVNNVGAISAAYLFASHNLDELLDGGSLYSCNTCSVSFRYPLPDAHTLNELYRTGSINHWQYEPANRPDWKLASEWLATNHTEGAILDIGCFDGAFFELLNPKWDLYGIEINEAAIEHAKNRGVDIIAADLSELTSIKSSDAVSFDAVVAFDVIEHVPDPRELLVNMMAVTRNGGTIILASGNRDAFSWKLMGSSYWYCTIPEHLAFISTSWCHKIAQELKIELVQTITYSHEQRRTAKLVAREWATNLLYRFAPSLFARLRRSGLGEKDTSTFEELAYYPPTWTTARDHIMAIFRKP